MQNATSFAHTDTHDMSIIVWFVLPLLLGISFYSTLVAFAWPYARLWLSPWLLVVVILFPPFFPFLLLALVVLLCTRPLPLVPVFVSSDAPPGRHAARRVNSRRTR